MQFSWPQAFRRVYSFTVHSTSGWCFVLEIAKVPPAQHHVLILVYPWNLLCKKMSGQLSCCFLHHHNNKGSSEELYHIFQDSGSSDVLCYLIQPCCKFIVPRLSALMTWLKLCLIVWYNDLSHQTMFFIDSLIKISHILID